MIIAPLALKVDEPLSIFNKPRLWNAVDVYV